MQGIITINIDDETVADVQLKQIKYESLQDVMNVFAEQHLLDETDVMSSPLLKELQEDIISAKTEAEKAKNKMIKKAKKKNANLKDLKKKDIDWDLNYFTNEITIRPKGEASKEDVDIVDVPEQLKGILDRGGFEHDRACSNTAFYISRCIDGTAKFDQDLYQRLKARVISTGVQRTNFMYGVVLSMFGCVPASFKFIEDNNVCEYKLGSHS